jgi:hypothetical protein
VIHGQEFYLDLTRATADNFHRSWRKRHGVILDGEVAAVFYRRGALDAAAKLYEKVTLIFGPTNVLDNYSVLLCCGHCVSFLIVNQGYEASMLY